LVFSKDKKRGKKREEVKGRTRVMVTVGTGVGREIIALAVSKYSFMNGTKFIGCLCTIFTTSFGTPFKMASKFFKVVSWVNLLPLLMDSEKSGEGISDFQYCFGTYLRRCQNGEHPVNCSARKWKWRAGEE
jgi:hypothetical protein